MSPRSLGLAALAIVVAGFLIYAVLGRGDAAAFPSRLGVGLALVGLGVAVVGVGVRFGRSSRIGRYAAFIFGGLLVFSGLVGPLAPPTEPQVAAQPTSSASAAPGSTVSSSPAASISPSASPSVAPSSEAPASAVAPAQLSDAAGDMVDEDDQPAETVPFQDIRLVMATVDGADLAVTIDVESAPPPNTDPVIEQIVYGFLIDGNGDDSPEYQVLYQNVEGGWSAGITRLTGDIHSYEGPEFPGVASIITSRVLIRVPTDFLGASQIRIAALTEHDLFTNWPADPTAHVLTKDMAPDHMFPDGTDWLVVTGT